MSVKKVAFIIVGLISLCLGIIGIFMPVLPTTPFLLLSSYLFLRSSKKLHSWLINHKIFGEYIYNYMEYRAVKKSAKLSAYIFLWISLTISITLINNIYVKLFLIFIGVAVTIHVASLKTLNLEDSKKSYQKLENRK